MALVLAVVVPRPTRLGLDSSARKPTPADSPLEVGPAAVVVGIRQTAVDSARASQLCRYADLAPPTKRP